MKKIIFIISLVLSIENSYAQHEIIYNFMPGTTTTISKVEAGINQNFVKYKSTSVFKIIDVNKFLYDITVKGENMELHSELPEVFKLFFDVSKFSSTEIDEAKAAPAPPGVAAAAATLPPNVISFNANITVFKQALDKLEETKSAYDDIYKVACTDGKTGAIIIADINGLTILGQTGRNKISIINECKSRLSTFNKSYSQVKDSYKALKGAEKDIVSEAYDDVNDMFEKVTQFKYDDLFNTTAILFEKATNPDTYIYTSSPIIAENDYINYNIDIKPKTGLKFTEPTRKEKFDIPINIKGGWKVDFSTGIFFGSNDIEDRKYRTIPVLNDTINVDITHNNRTSATKVALGAMMHVSPRYVSGFSPALSFGLGLNSTNFTNALYCIGLSGIFGKEDRLILSLGAIASRIDVLKGNFTSGQRIKKADIESDIDLTEKAFQFGYFIGITYNLTNKKKGQ
jgi:hypothetical protein